MTEKDKLQNEPPEEIKRACLIYRELIRITDQGFDAEVKQVKGKIKILKVQKKVSSEIELEM